MTTTLINALRDSLASEMALRKSRLESLCVLIVGVLVSRTVNLSHLAGGFPSTAEIASNYRRLQRFFEQVHLDYTALARVIVQLTGLGQGPWLLALDRTNWKLGRRDVNILMLAVLRDGITVPILWTVMDRAGNSTSDQRSALLCRFCAIFGAASIAGLIADREFVGTAWMTYLAKRDIPFILRACESIGVLLLVKEPRIVSFSRLRVEGFCGGRPMAAPGEVGAQVAAVMSRWPDRMLLARANQRSTVFTFSGPRTVNW